MSDERYQVNVSMGVAEEPEQGAMAMLEDEPFRIVVLGDFSGRETRGITGDLADRRPVPVDLDNLDEVMATLAPRIHPRQTGAQIPEVRVSRLDDFHPDRLCERLPLFQQLREAGKRLAAPSGPATPPKSGQPAARLALSDSLLDQIVGVAPDETLPPAGDLADFIERIIAPHVVRELDATQQSKLALIDAAITESMRLLLHDPAFQAVESLWRAVALLTRRIQTGVELYLVDASRGEIAADQGDGRGLEETALHRMLVATGARWAVLVGAYSFAPELADLRLLARLAQLARSVDAPWISAAELGFLESAAASREAEVAWASLRRVPDANWLGLGLPRFLLRVPYGVNAAACESFPFEEMAGPPTKRSEYLWGNPAFAGALALAETFQSAGWGLHPGATVEIDGMPLHIAGTGADARVEPCTEAVLGERAVEQAHQRGLTPLVWFRDSDRVRVAWRSVADPPAALRGGWATGSSTVRNG